MSRDVTLPLDEGERQMVLMALAHLRNKRPGWDFALNEIAKKIDNVNDGRAELFDGFSRLDLRANPPTLFERIVENEASLDQTLMPSLPEVGVEGGMSQAHSKFKAFITQGPITQAALDQFANDLNGTNVAPKSVGVEYLEGSKRTILSIGYSEGHRYSISLRQENLGKVEVTPDAIAKALEAAASRNENVICHEFYATEDGTFYAVLMLQA